jgi:hypothetical protein
MKSRVMALSAFSYDGTNDRSGRALVYISKTEVYAFMYVDPE